MKISRKTFDLLTHGRYAIDGDGDVFDLTLGPPILIGVSRHGKLWWIVELKELPHA